MLPAVVYGRVYHAYNRVNGKSYVGITKASLSKRWKQHQDAARMRHRHGTFQRAISKYGASAFELTELETASSHKHLLFLEQFYVTVLGSLSPNGYNLTTGGKGYEVSAESRELMRQSARIKVFTDEHRQNLSIAAQRRELSAELRQSYTTAGEVWTGRNHTEETRAKMRRSHTGKVLSEEHKANIGRSCKGKKLRCGPNRGWAWRGRKHSAETKAIISAKAKARAAARRLSK